LFLFLKTLFPYFSILQRTYSLANKKSSRLPYPYLHLSRFKQDRCLNCGVQRYVLFLVLQQFFERNFKKNNCVETSSLTIKHL